MLNVLAAPFLVLAPLSAVTAHATSANTPMVTKSPDGTFTVQKEPSKEKCKGSKTKEGLVIRPQVVVPIVPTNEQSR